MFDEVCSQKHGSHFTVEFIPSLQDTLEGTLPLVSMSCIENFVVGVDSSLHNWAINNHKELFKLAERKWGIVNQAHMDWHQTDWMFVGLPEFDHW